MEIKEVLGLLGEFNIWLAIIGVALLATTILPRVFANYPFSMPIVILILGYVAVALPLGLDPPDPQEDSTFAEHLTELGVIVSLMGAGLKIDRPFSIKGWNITWRLLGITMILTIGLTALIGWWIAALLPPAAILLGAVVAPTDPVIASEVQVGAPGMGSANAEKIEEEVERKEDSLRFSLTSEAGLNDGLAFPFTNMAVAMVLLGSAPENWFTKWLLVDVFYQLIVAVLFGIGLGYVLAKFILSMPAKTNHAKAIIGLGALAATFLIYGITEIAGGYGFIATFVGALTIRSYERDHHYHKPMHLLIEKSERLFIAGILISLGGAIAGGLFDALNWQLILCAVLIVFIIRPLTGMIGLFGLKSISWRERLAISFLGIKGIGTLYYLSYAFNKGDFQQEDEIWALAGLVVVISIFVHGITATPITKKLDAFRLPQ